MIRKRALQVVLLIAGLFFVALVYPLTTNLLHASQSEVEAMFFSIYVTLGIFLLLAIPNPPAHRKVIAFTAWSSFAHAAVMAIQAVQHPADRRDLLGGVAFFAVIGVALVVLFPEREGKERASVAGAA